MKRWDHNTFDCASSATTAPELFERHAWVDDKLIELNFWDTSGLEGYEKDTKACCKRADAFIMVYDRTDRISFYEIKGRFREMVEKNSNKHALRMIIGNYADLDRSVTSKEALKLAEELNAGYIETSAVTGFNVDTAFEELFRELARPTSRKLSNPPSERRSYASASSEKEQRPSGAAKQANSKAEQHANRRILKQDKLKGFFSH